MYGSLEINILVNLKMDVYMVKENFYIKNPSIRDHIRRSEALALDQQSRDQFGNMESCSHLSKRTLEVVTVMDAEEDVTNLSKIGGRNVTVNDIIEKGMA